MRYITTATPSISLHHRWTQRSIYAESNADFVHKLEIAQKEANETETWLSVLFKSGIIDEATFKSLRNKCGKIRRMLIASITTVKAKINGQK
ncbi:MAG: four helix bundle protein [Clostridia bacterium]|nr:four helix bundle protein [Clostridia bacterium]